MHVAVRSSYINGTVKQTESCVGAVVHEFECSNKLSFQFLAPVSSLLSVFQFMIEVSFSG